MKRVPFLVVNRFLLYDNTSEIVYFHINVNVVEKYDNFLHFIFHILEISPFLFFEQYTQPNPLKNKFLKIKNLIIVS